MRLLRFGKTALQVSELTLGTSALHGTPGEARSTISRALALGINTIEIDAGDQAVATLIGEVLEQEKAASRVHILARIPSLARLDLPSPHVLVQQAYPGVHIRARTEALLKTLGVERLALQHLHAWCPEWLHEGDWRETAEQLRSEGKIAGFGISLFDHDVEAGVEAVADAAIDAVQAMYNVFDPAAGALFALAQQHDVAVIARAPLHYGALAGSALTFPDPDWRSAYFCEANRKETLQRAHNLDAELPADALRFSLSHPAISTVAVGMRTPAQVEANVAAAERGPLPAERLAAFAAHRWLV